jgi:hypothetical protein
MTLAFRCLRAPSSATLSACAALAAAVAGCASHAGGTMSGTGGGSASGAGGAVSSASTSSTSASGTSSSGAMDVCGAASGTLAWTASIASVPGLALVDIGAGPTDDVVVADMAGPSTFEQHRWSSAGTLVSTHQDTSGAYTGPMFTSGLFMDLANDAFYGVLLTGPQGNNTGVELLFNRLAPNGTAAWSLNYTKALPTSQGEPTVTHFSVSGDASTNLHSAFQMGTPAYLGGGVLCYTYGGSDLGPGAGNLTSTMGPKDLIWNSPDNNIVLFQALTASKDYGCGTLAVPAAGAVALVKANGGGGCIWDKLLALPTAAVKGSNFRLGADGSMLAAVVYAGTIDFGGGPITSTGTTSLAVAKLDSNGSLLWAKSFGGAGSNFKIGSVGASSTGNMILTAGYSGTVDLGGGPLPSSNDTFLAVFDLAGHYKWAKTVTTGGQGSLLAAAGKCGLVLATNSPGVNLGTGPLSTVQGGVASIGVAALGM